MHNSYVSNTVAGHWQRSIGGDMIQCCDFRKGARYNMKQNVDVLAIFDVGALHPRPVKFKVFERGLKRTVNVGAVKSVNWIGSGYVKRIVYECTTLMNGREIPYKLSYYYKESRWELEM